MQGNRLLSELSRRAKPKHLESTHKQAFGPVVRAEAEGLKLFGRLGAT